MNKITLELDKKTLALDNTPEDITDPIECEGGFIVYFNKATVGVCSFGRRSMPGWVSLFDKNAEAVKEILDAQKMLEIINA